MTEVLHSDLRPEGQILAQCMSEADLPTGGTSWREGGGGALIGAPPEERGQSVHHFVWYTPELLLGASVGE